MKKMLLALAAIVGLPILALAALFCSVLMSFLATTPIVDGLEPVPGVRTIQLRKFSSCFALDSRPGRIVLVDSGMDPSATAIMYELVRRGLESDAVEAILLTHGHAANLGGLSAFPRAVVCVMEPDVALAEGKTGTPSPFGRLVRPRPTGVAITRVLHDGETIKFGKLAIRAFAVPGHTRGSAVYLARGVLFMGDSADSLKKGGMREAKWWFSESLETNRESLRKLVSRLKPAEVKAIVFGHSGALMGLKPLQDFAREN